MSNHPRLDEWPKDSPATRSLRQKTWTVVLRCFSCSRRFAVRKVTLDRLALASQVPCLHCGADPAGSPMKQVHKIIDMRDDSAEAMPRSEEH